MTSEIIFTTLLQAATALKEPLLNTVTQALRDAYEAAKSCVQKKLSTSPASAHALALALEQPASAARKSLLLEESQSVDWNGDSELIALIQNVAARLPHPVSRATQSVTVEGNGNQVQVAGRDLVVTQRHLHRTRITPDERHVNDEQRAMLRGLIAEVAERLASNGRPNFAAPHRLLQRRFNVASYTLITAEQFIKATSFLRQLRASQRTLLRRRNPAAYRYDFIRTIHASARTLGWDQSQLLNFVQTTLALPIPLRSLQTLSTEQLQSLATAMRQKTARHEGQ
jgi:hypothetical protein